MSQKNTKKISSGTFNQKKRVPLFFIVGPTCSGKSEWGLKLAETFSGSILNADSIQFYEGLNIGSAKPEFHKTPHVPHFLFQEAKPPQVLTAGDFRRKALKVLKKEISEGRTVFATGGSGFYIQALEKGMFPVKPIPKKIIEKLNDQKKKKGFLYLYEELLKKDPVAAKTISPKDHYRVIRALAVIKNEGRLFSEIKKENQIKELSWPYKKIGLKISKENLRKRIVLRVEAMLKKGLVEETESFANKGFAHWKPLQSVGYKECLLYLKGEIKKEDLKDEIVRRTLNLAKKQKTWFQKDKGILWENFDSDPLKIFPNK